MIDGSTLIAWGFRPGRWFHGALATANAMHAGGADDDAIFVALQAMQPAETLLRTNGVPFAMLIEPDNEQERANVAAVAEHMDAFDAGADHRGRRRAARCVPVLGGARDDSGRRRRGLR